MWLTITVVFIALVTPSVICLVKVVKKEKRYKKSKKAMQDFLIKEGNIDQLNPSCTAEQQAVNLPYDENKWEVPRKNITPGKDFLLFLMI